MASSGVATMRVPVRGGRTLVPIVGGGVRGRVGVGARWGRGRGRVNVLRPREQRLVRVVPRARVTGRPQR